MCADQPTRKAARLSIYGGVQGEVMVYEPMTVKEISTAGALIETAFPLLADSLHDLRLKLGDTSIVVKGRIVHSHISEVEHEGVLYAVGVEFVDPSERVVEVIARFLQGNEARSV